MNPTQHNALVNFIWGIADVLRDVYVRGKYRDVILPMTVIRRLDALLEPTKDDVLRMKERLDRAKVANQDAALAKAAGQAFYNASPFTLRRLLDNPKQLRANFEAYLNGFSANVQEILTKFKFHNQIPTLADADVLGHLIAKFISPDINLSIAEVHNGSSLFTGDAGQGESNIRRWILENDWLEAIIALPLNMFYNTGIATYVWVLSNNKPAARIDESKTKIGYEISFTRYFYKPQPLRSLDEIKADILAVEKESEGLLEKILGGAS